MTYIRPNIDDSKRFFELRRQLDMITDSTSLATWEQQVKSAVDRREITGTQRATLASLWRIVKNKAKRA